MGTTVVVALSTFAATAVLTGLLRRYALRSNLLDLPNERSSHSTPTPRGGGAAIFLAASGAITYLGAIGAMSAGTTIATIVGGSAIALVGWIDDRHNLPARLRFSVHLAASLLIAWQIGWLEELTLGLVSIPFGWFGLPLTALGCTWLVNLTNFMDGTDGLAAGEAAFVLAAGAWLVPGGGLQALGLAGAAGCCGFLLWNRPPAKIFMGDVGSGFLGFLIAVAVLVGTNSDPQAGVWPYAILVSGFFVDSTVTLGRRILTGQPWSEPHRLHAYQKAARRWGHSAVLWTLLALNLCWALPLAWLARQYPAAGAFLALICCLLWVCLCLWQGAGVVEEPRS